MEIKKIIGHLKIMLRRLEFVAKIDQKIDIETHIMICDKHTSMDVYEQKNLTKIIEEIKEVD